MIRTAPIRRGLPAVGALSHRRLLPLRREWLLAHQLADASQRRGLSERPSPPRPAGDIQCRSVAGRTGPSRGQERR